MKGEETIDRGP